MNVLKILLIIACLFEYSHSINRFKKRPILDHEGLLHVYYLDVLSYKVNVPNSTSISGGLSTLGSTAISSKDFTIAYQYQDSILVLFTKKGNLDEWAKYQVIKDSLVFEKCVVHGNDFDCPYYNHSLRLNSEDSTSLYFNGNLIKSEFTKPFYQDLQKLERARGEANAIKKDYLTSLSSEKKESIIMWVAISMTLLGLLMIPILGD